MTEEPKLFKLLATVKQPNGNVAIADAPLSLQGEYYMVDMPKYLAENIWDAQRVIYTLETNHETIGKFDVICTGFVPYLKDDQDMARAAFVRSEFLRG